MNQKSIYVAEAIGNEGAVSTGELVTSGWVVELPG